MKRLVALIASVFFTACLSLNNCFAVNDRQVFPELTLNSLKITGFQYPRLDLKVDSSVFNPNQFDVNVSAIDCELFIQDHSVLVGSLKAKVRLYPKTKQELASRLG